MFMIYGDFHQQENAPMHSKPEEQKQTKKRNAPWKHDSTI